MNIKKLTLFGLFLSIFPLFSTAQKDKDWIVIDRQSQKLEFFITPEGDLNAKLIVALDVESKTSLPYRYKQAIFFDDNTKVENINKRTAERKRNKVKPIISDYESNGIFHSDLKLCYFDHLFQKEGERIRIEYEKIFTDVKFLDPLYFSAPHAVNLSKIEIAVPDWMELNIKKINFDKETPKTKTEELEGVTTYSFLLKDLKDYDDFSRVPRRNKLSAHLIPIPASYTNNGQQKELMKEVDDLYEWYASLIQSVDNENDELKFIVEKLTADQKTDLEKIKAIYYWVQDNIRYIAFENGIMGFQPESCQKVFNNRYGDCKGMANLTKEMLKIAGYDARLTWLGTSDLPYDYTIPSLLVDNHMICTVFLNGEKIYLDATEKYADLYNYAYRIRGKEVMIEDGENFIIEKIPASNYEKNREYYQHEFDLVEDKLVGTGKYSLDGNRKTRLFNIMASIPESEWDKSLTSFLNNANKNIKLNISNQPDLKDRDDTPVFEYEVSIANQIIDLGDELYVNPEIEYEFYDYEMEENRNVAFEFSGTYFIEQETILNIPESWEVSYLPEALEIQHDKYSFKLEYKKEKGKIKYNKSFKIKNPLLETHDFSSWNTAIEKVTDFYSDQIILSKQK
ncbi:MAG: transglutaminase domain-containing protein [Bacteroidota bacterium]